MRTTLVIDDDVIAAAKERASREGKTIGAVMSELARTALTGQVDPAARSTGCFHGFEPFPPRGSVVTNTLIDRLREDQPE